MFAFSTALWLFLTFNFNKSPLGETGCLDNPYFLLTGCLGIQFFDSPLSQHSQLGNLWLPSPHCTAPVWLMGQDASPLVTRCFLLNPYLGKQRISLEVTGILSMCLCSHTQPDYNQLLIILDWYLNMLKSEIFYL